MDRRTQADKAFLKWSEATSKNVVHIADAWYAAVEWADRTMLDKVCKWLDENMQDYANCVYEGEELTDEARVSSNLIKDLRKGMEEQQ